MSFKPPEAEFDPGLCTKLNEIFLGKTVAVFGCGRGNYVEILREVASLVIGVESDPVQLATRQPSEMLNYRLADLTEPLWIGRCFDFVLCLELGQHVSPDRSPILIENLDRHAKEGIILSWQQVESVDPPSINAVLNEEIEARFAALGYVTDDARRDNLREGASLACYRGSLMALSRKQSPAFYCAQFIGGPLHRKMLELNSLPQKYLWTNPIPDPALNTGFIPGCRTHRYGLHDSLIDNQSTYFYEGG